MYVYNCIYCMFFNPSYVDWYLGWFHNLTTVNNATININVQVPLHYVDLSPLEKCPGVVLWGHVLFLV